MLTPDYTDSVGTEIRLESGGLTLRSTDCQGHVDEITVELPVDGEEGDLALPFAMALLSAMHLDTDYELVAKTSG